MQNFLSHLETEFYDLTGVLPEGIIGLFGGLLLFSLIIYLIRFEKKKEIILSDLDVSNDIGDEINAKINLSPTTSSLWISLDREYRNADIQQMYSF